MRCILRLDTDPYFNLAAEEYIFRNFDDDTFMLWRNEPSVIIGKHQNAFSEVNHEFVRKHNIKVVRRISGGGTVYHDQGNLNFTFITKGDINNLVDFSKFTVPIIESLLKLGLAVQIGPRNSLYLEGKKISGNAEHIIKDKVIHHGTLLFNANLDYLNKALTPSSIKYQDKAVKSVKSDVTNISNHLSGTMKMKQFADFIFKQMLNNKYAWQYELNDIDINSINQLKEEKYQTWEWNYGYSPAFTFLTSINIVEDIVPIEVSVINGRISNIIPRTETPSTEYLNLLLQYLRSEKLDKSIIETKLNKVINKRELHDLLDALFVYDSAEHLQNLDVLHQTKQ